MHGTQYNHFVGDSRWLGLQKVFTQITYFSSHNLSSLIFLSYLFYKLNKQQVTNSDTFVGYTETGSLYQIRFDAKNIQQTRESQKNNPTSFRAQTRDDKQPQIKKQKM